MKRLHFAQAELASQRAIAEEAARQHAKAANTTVNANSPLRQASLHQDSSDNDEDDADFDLSESQV